MNFNKISFTAVLVSIGAIQTALASDQSDSKGFIDDSSLTVKARNMYMNRDNRAPNATRSYGEEWAQGFIGTLQSGYTQGTVGFGVDAIGMLGLKLDTGGGRFGGGTNLLETDSDGAKDEYSKAGGVFKMRISNTVLKYGTQYSTIPVAGNTDSRLLPETMSGFTVSSKEFKNLRLDSGHLTGLTGRNQSNYDSGRMTALDYVGGVYKFSPQLSTQLYYAKTEDFFRKYYTNINYSIPLTQLQSLTFDFNAYDTKSIEAQRSGDLDNLIWSMQGTYKVGAHSFSVAYQRVSGKGDYVYGPDGNANFWFANSVNYSDFNYEDEKSWQAAYGLDMAPYGVPGLSFVARYVKGFDFKNGSGVDIDGKAWERDLESKYVVQSGPAKDLSFRIRHASYRSNERGGQIDEVRVITEYPINIF